MGVANDQSDRRIPTKPVGGLLSNIGNGGPCLWLTGHAIPDRPEMVLHPSLGPRLMPTSRLERRPLSPLYSGSRTHSQRA